MEFVHVMGGGDEECWGGEQTILVKLGVVGGQGRMDILGWNLIPE